MMPVSATMKNSAFRSVRVVPPVRLVAALVAGAVLAGCAGTPYHTPAVQLPDQWKQAAGHTREGVYGSRWWTSLGDSQLTALIDDALARNPDLAVAAWKVRSARLAVGNAVGNMLPTPSANVSVSSSRALDSDTANSSRSSSASLGVSWEVDLWGRLAASKRMADWEAAATEQDREAAAQALVATVAKTYWQIATLDQKIERQRASIDTARKTLQIAEVQYRAGSISGLDLAQSRQTLASQEAALTTYVQQRVEQRHALSILFDAPPESLPEAAQHPRLPALAALPAIPAGVPADVLGRRPDLQAAEMRLRESLANVDATRTSYYPTLTLTGTLGSGSASLANVLGNPVATLGAGLVLPFLKFGEMQRNTAIAQSSYEQAIISFRKTLYSALADVENALSNRTQLQTQEARLTESLAQARRAEELTRIRYRAGAVAMKIWLDAQETRRTAEMALLDVQLNRTDNLVTTYQALGGAPVLQAVPVGGPAR